MKRLPNALEWMAGFRFCQHSNALGPAPLSAAVSQSK